MNTTIIEAAKNVVVAAETDLVVCGAGPAGVCAAIAAARSGVQTCLIESAGCLGGTWTAGLLGWIIDHEHKPGILQELKNELQIRGGTINGKNAGSFPFDIETMKLLLEEKCLAAGVRIRLHTRVVGVLKESGGRIAAIISESKSGREAWRAKVVIDATGDGDVGYAAGCSYAVGQPISGMTQPMSLLCLLTGIEFAAVREYLEGYSTDWFASKARLKADLEAGGISPSYAYPSLFMLTDGLYYLMANHQYQKSATNADDITAATLTARREIHAQVAALRKIGKGWSNLRLVATAEHIGVREGRRLKALYEISGTDVINGTSHLDAVCHVTFGPDVHALDSTRNKGLEHTGIKAKPYDIPLRALISAEVPNLMMAGRCIGGDFLAHSSYRVTGNAARLGEAAGIAAALAIQNGVDPAAVDFSMMADKLSV